MAQTVLRIEKGFFSYENVFELSKHDDICMKLEECVRNGEFTARAHVDDHGIERHPLWLPRFDPLIEQDLLRSINHSNIPKYFGFNKSIPHSSLSASFVLYYSKQDHFTSSKKVALSPHQDISLIPNMHILSVVYTIKSLDCIGGSLAYSNKWDGSQKYSRDMTTFDAKDNSIYCFNGDYVSHVAYGVEKGYRFAIVMFFNTQQTDMDVSVLWNYPNEDRDTFCTKCYKGFSSVRHKDDHMLKCKRN